MFPVNIYIGTDTTCPREMNRWFGYVVEYHLKKRPDDVVTREGFEEIKATYNQAVLMALLSALKKLRKPCEITIYTENRFIADSITHRLNEWAAKDFTGSKGEPVKNADLWRAFFQASECHSLLVNTGSHGYLAWLESEIKKRKEKQVETPAGKAKETRIVE